MQAITLPAFQSIDIIVKKGEGEYAYEEKGKCIDRESFNGCTSLSEFRIHPGSTCFSVKDGMLCNAEGNTLLLFPPGRQADTYTIPSDIKTIREYAFENCYVVYKDDNGNEHVTHNVIWLTDIPEDGEVGAVRITTLGDGSYCAMWEQRIGEEGSVWYTVLDECGNTLRRPTKLENARLSNTSIQPLTDGTKLKWATVCGNVLTWYTVDLAEAGEAAPAPQDPDAFQLGDVNGDGSINASDAAIILQYAAAVGAGKTDARIADFIKA